MRKWDLKEQNHRMIVLYERYHSTNKVGEILGLSGVTVYRRLRKMGLVYARGQKGERCREAVGSGVDRRRCNNPTAGASRCPFHAKMRVAANNRDSVARYQASLDPEELRRRRREASQRWRKRQKHQGENHETSIRAANSDA
jgi:hypothetical protein